MYRVTSETCGDVSKRQGTVRLALSVALTNGHHSHLLEQILASSQKIVRNLVNICNTKGNYKQIHMEDVGGRDRVGEIRNVGNMILGMGDLMRNQVNTD